MNNRSVAAVNAVCAAVGIVIGIGVLATVSPTSGMTIVSTNGSNSGSLTRPTTHAPLTNSTLTTSVSDNPHSSCTKYLLVFFFLFIMILPAIFLQCCIAKYCNSTGGSAPQAANTLGKPLVSVAGPGRNQSAGGLPRGFDEGSGQGGSEDAGSSGGGGGRRDTCNENKTGDHTAGNDCQEHRKQSRNQHYLECESVV